MNTPSDTAAARQRMVDKQLRARGISDRRVLEAFQRVPREQFLPAELAEEAYADRAVGIDCEQTISQPYIVALMTEALHLDGSERVLEIGTGSGYQTAILAELAGSVYSIERHAPLSQQAAERLTASGYVNVHLRVGDGTRGWPEEAPFDRILITAAAPTYPPALWEQLAEGGILIGPFGPGDAQTLEAVRKFDGRPQAMGLTACRFVPLIGEQ